MILLLPITEGISCGINVPGVRYHPLAVQHEEIPSSESSLLCVVLSILFSSGIEKTTVVQNS